MNRHTQSYGVRHYFGDDLIELQNEPLKAIDAIFQQYGPCVVSGCNITPTTGGKYNVSSGVVALSGADHPIIVMPFAGATDVNLPAYMISSVEIRTRAYDDGNIKPIAHNYSARLTAAKPSGPHIEITETTIARFADVLQDSAHRFITDAERSGWNKIGTTMASASNKGLMSSSDKVKLDGIAEGANKYIHPNDNTSRHVSDTEKQTWNSKASTATATAATNGLMASGDKNKLDGIAERANNYVHPTGSNSLHMTLLERLKLNMVDNSVKFPIAGCVDMPDDEGLIPSSKLTILKGDFSAEVINLSNTGISTYYRITHNLNTLQYHPMVNIQYDLPVLADAIIKRIEPNYFEVITSVPNTGDTTEAVGWICPFRFTIMQFI